MDFQTITKNIELNNSQKEAIKFFEENGYLVIDAARQTGKTLVLREIIRRSEGKIGVMIGKEYLFNEKYKDLDCEFISEFSSDIIERKFDLIIGDEVFIKPRSFKKAKTACAYTPNFVICDLFVDEGIALRQEKILSGEDFKKEYGRYLTTLKDYRKYFLEHKDFEINTLK